LPSVLSAVSRPNDSLFFNGSAETVKNRNPCPGHSGVMGGLFRFKSSVMSGLPRRLRLLAVTEAFPALAGWFAKTFPGPQSSWVRRTLALRHCEAVFRRGSPLLPKRSPASGRDCRVMMAYRCSLTFRKECVSRRDAKVENRGQGRTEIKPGSRWRLTVRATRCCGCR
jgi:hypothetical protein